MKVTCKTKVLLSLFHLCQLSVFAHAADSLCPRGNYTFQKEAAGLNELAATVTLPTLGYKVRLVVGPELILPPIVSFRCEKPTGIAAQRLTEYKVTLRTHFSRLTLKDEKGSQQLEAKSASANTETLAPKSCSMSSECGKSEFCDTTPKCTGVELKGVCAAKPQTCPLILDPVLGCDGVVYNNRCAAAAEGQSVSGRAKIR